LRRYLASLDSDIALRHFRLGPTVQLDDYPYVHLMRRIDDELRFRQVPPVFFASPDQPFREGRDWATLIELINEDYASLGTTSSLPAQPAGWLLDRFDRGRRAAGVEGPFVGVPEDVLEELESALNPEVAELATSRNATLASYEPGVSTVVIEFARGGPEGSSFPLAAPHGYQFSLSCLSPDILRRAVILYVWVAPEESRRRNLERARPGRDGDTSILHHGVPEDVMRENYGVDDFMWLLEAGRSSSIDVTVGDDRYSLPTVVFDNRVDHTSFLRDDPSVWGVGEVEVLHEELKRVFARLG
jgi:hypothetical protein